MYTPPPYPAIAMLSYTQRPDRKGTESQDIWTAIVTLPSEVTLKDPIESGLKDHRCN